MTNMKTTLRLVVEFNILFLTPTQKKKKRREKLHGSIVIDKNIES